MPMLKPEVPEQVFNNREFYFPLGSLPVNSIRQSWLSAVRSCLAKGNLYGREQRSDGTYHMLGGSVYHLAMDQASRQTNRNGKAGLDKWYGWAADRSYWRELIQELDNDPRNTYSGALDRDVFADKLVDPQSLRGVTCREIIHQSISMLQASGFRIIYSERRMFIQMDFGIGAQGTPFEGTIDLVLAHRSYKPSEVAIGDTKTSGMWNCFFRGKSPTGQSFKAEQISNYQQLLHYSWMGSMIGDWDLNDIQDLFIHTPVNLTRYVRGAKKGQFRGSPFHWGKPQARAIQNYSEDMVEWLTMMYNEIYPRMYPSVFGKILCDTCTFRDACLFDKKGTDVPEYLKKHMAEQPHVRD